MKQWTGSKLGKDYVKAVYCHPAYLTYMLSTSYKMPGWMTHKLESRFPREYQHDLVTEQQKKWLSCNSYYLCFLLCLTLWPHGLQHTRLPCPSPSPGACSNSCPTESMMPSNHLTLCCSLLLLPSIFSSIRVFSKESVLCIRWPKYWSFNFSISPSNEYSGWISFRINLLDHFAIQGLPRVVSNTTAQKHQFFSTKPSLQSNTLIHTWLLEKP